MADTRGRQGKYNAIGSEQLCMVVHWAHPTLSERSLCTKIPAAVVPSSKSTSTRMPTASPIKGSTNRTHGSASFASHFDLGAIRTLMYNCLCPTCTH